MSINQQVAGRRLAARCEADTRLAVRLGGTWTLLTQVLTAPTPRIRPIDTSSHAAAPMLEATLGHHQTTLDVAPAPLRFAADAPGP